MTNNQLLYQINTKRSKSLCLRLERLIEDADYHEKELNIYSREVCVYEICEIKLALDVIWDAQIDLFFKIRNDAHDYKNKVFMESIRVPKSRNVQIMGLNTF